MRHLNDRTPRAGNPEQFEKLELTDAEDRRFPTQPPVGTYHGASMRHGAHHAATTILRGVILRSWGRAVRGGLNGEIFYSLTEANHHRKLAQSLQHQAPTLCAWLSPAGTARNRTKARPSGHHELISQCVWYKKSVRPEYRRSERKDNEAS